MGVYIKDIEIPKEDELIYLVINNDGIVECVKSIAGSRDGEEPTTLIEIEKAKAIYIPEPHGRLIDADWFFNTFTELANYDTEDNAPTVIEGSDEGE